MSIGIDIGDVVCESDTRFFQGGNLAAAREFVDAFDTIARMVEVFGPNNNRLVSYCGQKVQGLCWRWLQEQKFFERTGFHNTSFTLPKNFDTLDEGDQRSLATELAANHALFCERRRHKKLIAERLKFKVFIDNRLKTLLEQPDSTELRIGFRPEPEELARVGHLLDDRFVIVQSWREVRKVLDL